MMPKTANAAGAAPDAVIAHSVIAAAIKQNRQ